MNDSQTRTLLALLTVYHRDGRATVRSVAAEGPLGVPGTHHNLKALRDAGLVSWEEGRHGSLRPLVEVVA